MKMRKAMALALAGALVLTTVATGTTSEAAKKTKLKTKKVSIFVKGKKKISITGKKAKHKYTFTSKKKKIAKVSKTGVITGVKAGKTTITVKDTWKQKGKKKTKKLGTINVTVKKKTTPKPKVTSNVPQPPVSQAPAPPASQAPDGGGTPTTPPDNPGTETSKPTATPPTTGTPTQTPIGEPTPPPTGKPTPPPPAQQTPTVYKPVNLADVEKVEGVTYNEETKSISVKNVEQFAIPLGYSVQEGHAIWVKLKGKLNGEQGFRSWLVNSVDNKGTVSNQWIATSEPGFKAPGEFEYTFQLVSEADDVSALLIKGAAYQVNIDDIELTSIETSYPIKDPTPPEPDVKAPTASLSIDKHNIRVEEAANAAVTVSAGEVTDVTWFVEKSDVASVKKDSTDAKKAVITGVTEGETNVTAEVKVTVEGKDFTVKADGTIHVAAKDALVVNATIESAPTEIQIADTAEMSVKIDAGEDVVTIEDIVWAVTEGDAATIDTESLEKGKVHVIGQKEGDVTISVTVTVKKGDKTASATTEVSIHVTPITYNIGKTLTFGTSEISDNSWVSLQLDEPLRIKKTDKVEVVFSAKAGDSEDSPSDTTTVFKMAMAPGIEEGVMTAYKLQEKATLRNTATRVGRAEFTMDKANFASNYSEINSIVGTITSTSAESVVVTIEKVLIIPTEKIALSLQAPGTFDKGAKTELQAEVDENDYTEIEWKSSDESIATVTADGEDPRKAVVNGVGEGEVTITVTVKKGDQVSEESVTRKVVDNYKNKPLKLDLTDVKSNGNQCVVNSDKSITIKGESGGGAGIPLPHELFSGDKIKVTVKGKFPDAGGTFRLYPSVDLITGSSTYTYGCLTNNGYQANWDVPEDQRAIQEALSTVNADKTFEVKDLEFTITKDNVVNMLFRQPSDGIIITEVIVTYL